MKKQGKQFSLVIVLAYLLLGGWSSAQQNQNDSAVKNEDIYVASLTEMTYPLAARLNPVEGIVVVRVKFDETGKVVSSEAISGPKSLIAGAVANAEKWRFHPTNAARTAVIIYEFRLDGFCLEGSHFTFRQPNVAIVTGCHHGESTTPGMSRQ